MDLLFEFIMFKKYLRVLTVLCYNISLGKFNEKLSLLSADKVDGPRVSPWSPVHDQVWRLGLRGATLGAGDPGQLALPRGPARPPLRPPVRRVPDAAAGQLSAPNVSTTVARENI